MFRVECVIKHHSKNAYYYVFTPCLECLGIVEDFSRNGNIFFSCDALTPSDTQAHFSFSTLSLLLQSLFAMIINCRAQILSNDVILFFVEPIFPFFFEGPAFQWRLPSSSNIHSASSHLSIFVCNFKWISINLIKTIFKMSFSSCPLSLAKRAK